MEDLTGSFQHRQLLHSDLLHSTSVEGYREMDVAPICGSTAGYILCVPFPDMADRGIGQPSEHNHKSKSGGQSSPGDTMNPDSPAYITKWARSWHFRVLSCSVLPNSRLCYILSYEAWTCMENTAYQSHVTAYKSTLLDNWASLEDPQTLV